MDDDDDIINICSELWNDLENFSDTRMSFAAPITSGFRFRYQSEIDKKSYSLLKSEKNATPILEIDTVENHTALQLELVTEHDKISHFNMLYEVPKDKMSTSVHEGIFYYSLKSSGHHRIKLDSLGIRKMKNKEAMIRIKQLYPFWSDVDAKSFFNKNKDIVRLKATLFQNDVPVYEIYSDIIKSQISKENKLIKIKYISPKVVAETGEQLIVVLEKKITTEDFIAGLKFSNEDKRFPSSLDQDGQTFVFNLPRIDCTSPTDVTFYMQCGDSYDTKPIKFLPVLTEPRKRKINELLNCNYVPLKRSNNTENQENIPQQLYPESGITESLETDSIQPMSMNDDEIVMQHYPVFRNDNDSSKDSGIHSGDRSSDRNSSDDEINSSGDESGDEDIEVEGFKRKKNQSIETIAVISIPPKSRLNDSKLDINVSNNATKKILSEVARIGHDFAFGKKPDELFERIEKQLPVVFTLQDDVGDTPLNNAILKGNVEHAFKILQIVRSNCEWALDLVNTSGHSALILAPACDVPPELIEKLLLAGCKLDLWDDTGKSAIVYAIEYQNVKALEVLLKHAQGLDMKNVLSRLDSSYYTPLQIAIMNGFKRGVEMLLELKDNKGRNYLVDVNETGLMNDETALHIAVSHKCDIEIIEMILNRPDININQQSSKITALHVANKMKLIEIINLLKRHNAVDLPSCSEVDTLESDEEIDEELEDMEYFCCDSNQNFLDKKPIVEMNIEEHQEKNVSMITDSMKQLSLKGEVKIKFIDILIMSDGPTLSVSELQSIVKPSYKSLFNKYGNTNKNKKDINELLDRFNCLPNSCGQLIDSLRNIGRLDLIAKIERNWTGIM